MRKVPNTDLTLSPMGLGSYPLAGVFGPVESTDFDALVRLAYELGITFFDTSPGYGDSELLLGKAVAGYRQQVVIASKVALRPGYTGEIAAAITRACEDSLRRLATDYLDLYHLHYDHDSFPAGEVAEGLEQLKTDGKIRYYGLGHVSRSRLATYSTLGNFTSSLMELHPLAQLPCWCLHQELAPPAIIGYSATGRGLLTGRYNRTLDLCERDIRRQDPLFQRENLLAGRRIAGYLGELGRQLHRTPAQLAIAWALAQSGVVSVLTSVSCQAHLRENLEGAHYHWPAGSWEEFTAFLKRVIKERNKGRVQNVTTLLSEGLANDADSARRDLTYLIESALTDGRAQYEELMIMFMQLQQAGGKSELNAIHRQLQVLYSG